MGILRSKAQQRLGKHLLNQADACDKINAQLISEIVESYHFLQSHHAELG